MIPYQFIPDEYSADVWEEVFDNPDAEHYCFSPSCYICSYGFTIDVCDSTFTSLRDHSKAGICTADELENLHLFMKKAWWSIFRMILCNQKSNTCRIPGVTPYTGSTGPLIVPLHEREGLIYRPMTKTQEKRIVAPKFRDPSKDPRAHWEWVGYPVHSRCWELLLHHELGAIAERDLATVLVALRQRCKENRCQSHAVVPKMRLEDPVRTKTVSDAIGLALEQAQRRKLKKMFSRAVGQEVWQVRTYNIPVGILYMILDYLPSQTVADMEKALDLRFNNTFWRSRISVRFFHEIEDVADDGLDWKRLCLKL